MPLTSICSYHSTMVPPIDDMLLVYRPVGHTHNGVDAVHKIHNQNLGNFVSGTLGVHAHTRHVREWLRSVCLHTACERFVAANSYNGLSSQELALHYPQVFTVNTPSVAVLNCQYDWGAHYKACSNPLSGFTKTKQDPYTVQAWRIKRGLNGLVETTWQPIASLGGPWLGMDGQPGSPGFCKLRGRPVVRPCVVVCEGVR